MNRRIIIFRADAGSDSGMGHFMRCLGMAQMLQGEYTCLFALVGPNEVMRRSLSENDIGLIELKKDEKSYDDLGETIKKTSKGKKVTVVLDGYNFTKAYQQALKELGVSLVYIDDLVNPGQVADVIINPSDSVSPANYLDSEKSRIFCGHKYALLRRSFMQAANEFSRPALMDIRSVFVCFGAADPLNAAGRAIRSLKPLPMAPQIHFVTSQMNRHLASIREEYTNDPQITIHTDLEEDALCELIKECDVAVCAPSTIAQECAAVGIPMLCLLSADNQRGIYESLTQNGLCVALGDSHSIAESDLTKNVLEATKDVRMLDQLVIRQKQWFDGKAPHRIRKIMEAL